MERQGALTYPLVGSEFVSGWPDRLVVHARGVAFFEAKSERGRLTRQQEHVLAELRARGQRAAVVRYVGDEVEVDGVRMAPEQVLWHLLRKSERGSADTFASRKPRPALD